MEEKRKQVKAKGTKMSYVELKKGVPHPRWYCAGCNAHVCKDHQQDWVHNDTVQWASAKRPGNKARWSKFRQGNKKKQKKDGEKTRGSRSPPCQPVFDDNTSDTDSSA